MEWRDSGIVLAVRRHGESAAILTCMTEDHGRHAGLVRGGAGKRLSGVLQPGNSVNLVWRGRLSEHLGTFAVEAGSATGGRHLGDGDRLAVIGAAAAVLQEAIPEREPVPGMYHGLGALLETLEGPHWASAYVKWEMGVLAAVGFGLDLSACAATGGTEDLAYVSPKSARAVSRTAAEPYLDQVLALPAFLLEADTAGKRDEVLDGLALTGFFLERHVMTPDGAALEARRRLVSRLKRH